MRLFRVTPRSGHTKKELRESLWEFLDRSSRPEVARLRELLERWFAAYPEAERGRIRRRLVAANEEQSRAAFFELYLFAMLAAANFTVEVPKPSTAGEKIEDFRAHRGGNLAFRVEAKYIGQERDHARQDALWQELEHILENVASGNMWFTVRLSGSSERQPRFSRIARAFERWLEAERASTALDLGNGGDSYDQPWFEMDEAGLHIEIRPMALKNPNSRSERSIGVWTAEPRWMRTDDKLRKGLKTKASRYGMMTVPFVLAVSLHEIPDETDLSNALFGDEVFTLSWGPDLKIGAPVPSRKPNGFWLGPNGPQNRRVSAIVVFVEILPWSVAASTPVIYHNPWAEHPLPSEYLPLPQMVPDWVTGQYAKKPGITIRQLLGLG